MWYSVVWWIGFDPAVGSEIRKPRLAAIVRTMRPAGISAHSHGASDQQHREAVPGEAVVTISEQRDGCPDHVRRQVAAEKSALCAIQGRYIGR